MGVKQGRWLVIVNKMCVIVDKMSMTRTITRSLARSTTRLKGRKIDDRADKGG